ncbi:MAG: hypothetical protein JJT88_08535 [Gammaproteobacteria bacterium]|nr:hypothetical protein [Gammaproteobacteria bacterium]
MPSYRPPRVDLTSIGTPRFVQRRITAVETAVPALLGTAPRDDASVLQPVVVHSAGEFEQLFGDGSVAATHLARAVAGFFLNAGGNAHCYVVNLGPGVGTVTPTQLATLDGAHDVSIVAAPGFTDVASSGATAATGARPATRMCSRGEPCSTRASRRCARRSSW